MFAQLNFNVVADTNYWKKYYNGHLSLEEPSPFSKYILNEYRPVGRMIELGCGSGRDTVHFASNNIEHITGIDQCPNVVERLSSLELKKATFKQGDFTRLTQDTMYDHIYSRFTLHSVNRRDASRTLEWAFQVLNTGGRFYIEVRSINDELFGVGKSLGDDAWFTDHYRRFIRIEQLSSELKSLGFNMLFEEESKGFAPYKNEDPSIIRVVAEKH